MLITKLSYISKKKTVFNKKSAITCFYMCIYLHVIQFQFQFQSNIDTILDDFQTLKYRENHIKTKSNYTHFKQKPSDSPFISNRNCSCFQSISCSGIAHKNFMRILLMDVYVKSKLTPTEMRLVGNSFFINFCEVKQSHI